MTKPASKYFKTAQEKFAFSVTDRNNVKISTNRIAIPKVEGEGDEPPTYEDENDGLCVVCFTDEANTVFLNCGHGGSCLTCAIDSIKRNNLCILCREVVCQILEINQTEQMNNGVYKVLNSYYVSKDGD